MRGRRADASPAALLAPRHWGAWAAVVLLKLAARLPYPLALALGRTLGHALRAALPRRRHIARVNLALCFPELDAGARERLLREHFESLGVGLIELGLAYWAPDVRLARLVTVRGLEHVDRALERGRGVLLLGAHFTTLEIGLRLLTLHRPCTIMYRPHNHPVFARVVERGRSRHRSRLFPRDDVRTLYASLRRNEVVWYAPDQNYRRHSVFAPFFGRPAATITTTARFARKSGAAVVPFVQHRLAGARGYELVIGPPLEDFPSGDEVADAARVNAVIEQAVRRTPAQYLWVHRRFKTQPDGTDVYA